ncbi:MAG: hypothetical protein HOC05_14730 [Gemmatimonadetes bacterium]|nr:hypothetical protein [Gemmatimonadota bacterium]
MDDVIDDLARQDAAGEAAMLELLLAKDRAVGPMVEALADPDRAASRPRLAHALAGLVSRVSDPRIPETLTSLLQSDPDPAVRSAVAIAAGYYRLVDLSQPLLDVGTYDSDGNVRHHSLHALRLMAGKLPADALVPVRERAAQLLDDPHRGVRGEAAIRAEELVGESLDAARTLQLQAQIEQADSAYREVLQRVPKSKRANYRLARLSLERGDIDAGLQRLREHGMLLDVPRLTSSPVIDGRVDEASWQSAIRADAFYQFVSSHQAALPSDVDMELYLAHDDERFYLAFVGFDEETAKLVRSSAGEDMVIWQDDVIEVYLDANLDHRSYIHLGVNSEGMKSDAWHEGGLESRDIEWDADVQWSSHVGDDRWSVEIALRFADPELPSPQAGTLWGFNFVRTYRGAEFSQWVRTYGNAHSPDDFGVLRFM